MRSSAVASDQCVREMCVVLWMCQTRVRVTGERTTNNSTSHRKKAERLLRPQHFDFCDQLHQSRLAVAREDDVKVSKVVQVLQGF